MLSSAHGYISTKIYNYLKDTNGIELNKKSLILGSIEPDFVPSLIFIPHYYPGSIDFIIKEIHNISQIKFINEKNFIDSYSKRLGIVIHYICDYFCYAHNNYVLEHNLIKHFLYEVNVNKNINMFENNFNTKLALKEFGSLNISEISSHILGRINTYVDCTKSYINDLTFALEESYLICISILTSSMKIKVPSAA